MKINFAHNVYDRPQSLLRTIEKERKMFPDCGVYVAYNNREMENHMYKFPEDVHFVFFPQSTHKIGCTNGAYHAIQLALIDKPDVIVFSHDDVFISNENRFFKNADSIMVGEYDFIGRTPSNLYDIGTEYVMMEAMFFSRMGATVAYRYFKPFQDEMMIEKDLRGSISPEVNMYNLVKKINKKKIIEYVHLNDPIQYNIILDDTMGYTHENIGKRGWKDEDSVSH